MRRYRSLQVPALVVVCCSFSIASAADWPMWRHDARRSAATEQELPANMQLSWTRSLPRLVPAWSDQPKLQFDQAYEPVVAQGRLMVASSYDDSVTAYSTRDGKELWKFFAEGPVRFAPLVHQGRVYFGSDDGYLYCLDASSGELAWKFRGGPSDRKVLGNERLISAWPVRGAPVMADDTIYFAAGIWPFMGIFLHALDAESDKVVWTNDGDGSMYIKQPHNSDSFAGVAPQGPLVAVANRLLVPGGRSVPACYDRTTGEFVYYQLAENGKRGGGYAVMATESLLVNGGGAFDLATEKYLGDAGELAVADETSLIGYDDGKVRIKDLATSKVEMVETLDRKGAKTQVGKWSIRITGEMKSPELTTLIKAGSRLVAGAKGKVFVALPAPVAGEKELNVTWEAAIEGTPVSLVAADDRLFVSTLEGELYCFVGGSSDNKPTAWQTRVDEAPPRSSDKWSTYTSALLDSTRVREGYCLAIGAGSGRLVEELLRQSNLTLLVIEPDAERAGALRKRLLAQGIGCQRASVLTASIAKTPLPPYVASLLVSEDETLIEALGETSLAQRLFELLRPYGGVAYLPCATDKQSRATEQLAKAKLVNGKVSRAESALTLVRAGALPGSANWTHEHADAANTRVSKDGLVKAPLGLLWFGGPSNERILPRHGHGPQPQVVDGRLYIEGVDMLRAVDIYTGRLLWEIDLPGVGEFYNNTAHQPGANASGTNFVATPDGVYIAYHRRCLRLDPASGKTLNEIQLPSPGDANQPPLWGYINVFEDYLVAGAEPLFDPARNPKLAEMAGALQPNAQTDPKKAPPNDALTELVKKALKLDNDNFSSSQRLVVMDRHSGQVHWTAQAHSGFRHNAICIGGGRLYAIDRLSGSQLSRLKRRGEEPPHKPRLVAFDLKTGKELWSTDQDVFGTWLSYSAEHDVLVEAGRTARDTLSDEPKGMRAYRAAAGDMLWENKSHAGPAMIQRDTILMAGNACELLTGKPKMREHPLSGELVEWTWSRNYGCNTPAASEHLLTFRSGAAGYFDLCNDGGTGNLGGFRSSCTNNLIVAGGLLNAPDYTRTCTCNYQNQTSLAMVHMPEAEMWTSFGAQTAKEAVRRLGLNLGAPGDRKAGDGTLWLELPSVGGNSPAVEAEIQPQQVQWFRRHSSQVSGEGIAWVAASGAEGIERLSVRLNPRSNEPRTYTIRLYFCEPALEPGQRRFDVSLEGKRVIENLDVAAEAGGVGLGLIKQFKGVAVDEWLDVEFTPAANVATPAAVLSGLELQAEGW
jgi:outer membrane protein assembly factor BamB